MSYRPSSIPAATGWARRLDEVMRERGLSRVALFEEVGPALGYGLKSRSAFLNLLGDHEPTDEQAAVLADRYGKPLPPAPPAVVLSFEERQLEAMNRQADATAALAAELRAWRTEDRARIERLSAALDQVIAGDLAHAGMPAQAAHGVRPGSAE